MHGTLVRTVIATALLITTAPAISWWPPVCISDSEPHQYYDFRVTMNNGWGTACHHGQNEPHRRYHFTYSFVALEGGDYEVRYAQWNGTSWSLKAISDTADEDVAFFPTIATYGPSLASHDVLIDYYDEDYLNEEQRYTVLRRRSADQGANWAAPDRISSSTDDESTWPSMATCQKPGSSSGMYYVHHVWADDADEACLNVWYDRRQHRQSFDSSYSSYSVQLTDNIVDVHNPSVAVVYKENEFVDDENYVYVVWYDDSALTYEDVWFRRSLNSGDAWYPKVNLSSTSGYESQAPCVAAIDNYVYAVWQEENPSDHRFDVYFKRSTNYGANWEPAECLSDDLPEQDQNCRPEAFAPSIAAYGSNVYVVFQSGWDTEGYGYWVTFMMSTDNGSSWDYDFPDDEELWTDEEPDLDDGEAGSFPSICVSKGEDGNPFVMIVCSALDPLDPTIYQVWMVRGNDINEPPEGGQCVGFRPLPSRSDRLEAALTSEGVRVNTRLAAAGPAVLTVFDIQGRAVRCLHSGWLDAGEHDFLWDCRHGSGRSAAGTYFVRLETDGTTATARVSVIGR